MDRKNSFWENIFSFKNSVNHKIYTILGIKFKFKYANKLNIKLEDGGSIIINTNGIKKKYTQENIQELRNTILANSTVLIKGTNSNLEIDNTVNFGTNMRIIISGINNKCLIKKNTKFISNNLIQMKFGDFNYIEIGENCSFTHGNGIFTEHKSKIIIGNDLMCASNVKFMATDFHTITDLSGKCINFQKTPMEIKDHVWIAESVYILKNAKIPQNSIIALGSTITKHLEKENCIYKNDEIIKTNVNWDRKILKLYNETMELN